METVLGQRWAVFAAGFVSHRSTGAGHLDEGLGLVLLSALLGAFCGLIVGLLMTHVFRFIWFLTGRHLNGNGWTIGSVVLGALLFAWLAFAGDGSD